MSKKINIKLKDILGLEFTIEQDANKGDYFSLNDIGKVNLEEVSRDIINDLIKTNKITVKESIISEFKKTNDYKDLYIKSREIDSIRNRQELLINNKELETISNYEKSDKYKDLIKSKLDYEVLQKSLEDKISSRTNEAIIKFKNIQEQNYKEMMEVKYELSNLKTNQDLVMKLEITKAIEEFKRTDSDYLNKVRDQEILNRNQKVNIKNFGEDLERWILNEVSNALGSETIEFVKSDKVINGTKADFNFTVYDNWKDLTPLITATIEAKSEFLNSKTKKKEVDHFEKLDRDRNNAKREIAILVSELEIDKNYIFRHAIGYKNMYVVRPKFLVPFLQILISISNKYAYRVNKEIKFRDREEALKEWMEFKTDLLDKTVLNIIKNFEKINSKAEIIINAAKKIQEASNIIEKSHIKTLVNKIEKFEIKKIFKE